MQKPPKPFARIEVITPEKATQVLASHENYRPLSPRRMDAYSARMRDGDWHFNSMLQFDCSGELVDGQNRLAAVVSSGLPQAFVCLYNVPPDAAAAIDNGQNRSRGHVLRAERGVANGTMLGALATGIEYGPRPPGSLTLNSVMLNLYDKHKSVIDAIVRNGLHIGGMTVSAVVAIPFGRAMEAHPERQQELLDCMTAMYEMRFTSPRMEGIRLFWSWLMANRKASGGAPYRAAVYMKLARAIEAFLNGERLAKLYAAASDPFEPEQSKRT